MAAWHSNPGDTFLVPSGPQGLHLFVLILGPVVLPAYGSLPQVAVVSATSQKAGIPFDHTCELQVGDHPFIQQPSFISYRHMRIDALPHVSGLVGSLWKPHQQCSPDLLKRIIDGVCISRMTPREFKLIFGCQ